ncbi:hypothetical protein ACFLZF_00780, partial [Nanoarchaeota archaeon]
SSIGEFFLLSKKQSGKTINHKGDLHIASEYRGEKAEYKLIGENDSFNVFVEGDFSDLILRTRGVNSIVLTKEYKINNLVLRGDKINTVDCQNLSEKGWLDLSALESDLLVLPINANYVNVEFGKIDSIDASYIKDIDSLNFNKARIGCFVFPELNDYKISRLNLCDATIEDVVENYLGLKSVSVELNNNTSIPDYFKEHIENHCFPRRV